MNRRRLAFASIAVATVLCVIGVSILAVAAGGSALAYKVNGTAVSQRTIDGQLHDIADSDVAAGEVKPTEGTLTSTVAATIITNNILRDLLRDAADRRGVKLTAADRAAGTSAVESQLGTNASKVPDSYRDLLTETYAYANALGLTDNEALNAFVQQQVERVDVYVNPRYGFWNPRYGVCPPLGCQALAQPSS